MEETNVIHQTRKNIDYSNSAVNLKNPPELQELMAALYEAQGNANYIADKIAAAIPGELKKAQDEAQDKIAILNKEIREAIDTHGSYQDVINGVYAVKQRKVSLSYDPKVFRTKHPDFAPAVIIETLDTRKLDGLIKGGLLDKGALITEGVATEIESFAYIIKG